MPQSCPQPADAPSAYTGGVWQETRFLPGLMYTMGRMTEEKPGFRTDVLARWGVMVCVVCVAVMIVAVMIVTVVVVIMKTMVVVMGLAVN